MGKSTAPMPSLPLQPPPEPVAYRCDHPGCGAFYRFGFSVPLGSPMRRYCAVHVPDEDRRQAEEARR